MTKKPEETQQEMSSEHEAESGIHLCGVIMPISATSSHSELHWRDVLMLVHRGIAQAGLRAINVWESATTDRISERIVANIFSVPIVIADISDLNPNVMLELGLRLASKKPTIVIVEKGGTIPFDIRDFEAIPYPSDLNILEMETFFEKLQNSLRDKFDSYRSDSYVPFLGRVVVDVLSPERREVGVGELILSRIDELERSIGQINSTVQRDPSKTSPSNVKRTLSRLSDVAVYLVTISKNTSPKYMSHFIDNRDIDDILYNEDYSDYDYLKIISVKGIKGDREKALRKEVEVAAAEYGGRIGINDSVIKAINF